MKKPLLIAEVKPISPFGFKSDKSWDELFQLAEKYGDIISIHTDARWGGSFDLVKKAKSLTKKPILAKGIHETDDLLVKAFEAGADYALVVGRIPNLSEVFRNVPNASETFGKNILIEPNTLEELKLIPEDMKVVWNSRDLNTGGFKSETFEQAREVFKGWLCQASNIKTIADMNQEADAVLVGTNLESFIDSLGK